MAEAIERVTLENAAEQLKSKIRSAFIELLPDEQWKEMVAAELKRFTQETEEFDRYQQRHVRAPSAFSKICTEVFTEHIKAQIKNQLASAEWQGKWGAAGNQQISEAIGSWLTTNSKALVEATVQALAGQAAQNLVQGMRHL